MKWLLLAVVVLATAVSDLLFSWDMKRHGEIDEFRPGVLARVFASFLGRLPVLAAVFCLAISFVAFLELLKVADLSFAVPASAASLVLETLFARTLLREPVRWLRWCGTALVAAGVVLIAL